MSHIGALIKKKRIEKGLTQFQLAVKLGSFSPMFISSIENGKALLPLRYLVALCTVLGIKKEEAVNAVIFDYSKRVKGEIG